MAQKCHQSSEKTDDIFQPFTRMIIAADRTGILPRLVRTPQHPLLDVHATNSTNFHLARLVDLPRISTGTITTPCTPTQCHRPPQKVQRATPAIEWWNATTSESAPGACTGHHSQLRQQDTLATQVSSLHQRMYSLRSDPYPLLQTCHHQANLRRHTTPCRHSADLPAWWKSKGSLGANVHSAERTGSCKQAPSNVCMLGFLLPGGKQLEAAYPRALQAFNFQIWH